MLRQCPCAAVNRDPAAGTLQGFGGCRRQRSFSTEGLSAGAEPCLRWGSLGGRGAPGVTRPWHGACEKTEDVMREDLQEKPLC